MSVPVLSTSLRSWLDQLFDGLVQAVRREATATHVLVGGGLVFLLFNIKGLPGYWHIRLFKGLFTHLVLGRSRTPEPILNTSGQPRLFNYLITSCSNPLIDCDYNLHKSNSTFFSDLDINRTRLMCSLFKHVISQSSLILDQQSQRRTKPLLMALGGTSCIFKREIKPLQSFEIWSRVFSWDEKWVYVVSYFVLPSKTGREKKKHAADEKSKNLPDGNYVIASSFARYVFKEGRVTVRPETVLQECGLIPPVDSDEVDNSSISWPRKRFEEERLNGLKLATKFTELEALPNLFDASPASVLGSYRDL